MPDLEKFSFHGDELDVVRDADRVWISVRRVCEALGVSLQGQLGKLRDKPWASIKLILMQVPGDDQRREIAVIDLDSLPMWLATIEPGRVGEGVREKLVRYQREAAAVLRDHFLGRRGAAPDLSLLARMVDTIERLEARIASLEARPLLSARPSLGAAAKLHVLGPLMDVARLEARAARHPDPVTVRRLRKLAEDRLRERLGYHRTGGQAWALFPQARLGELHCELARLQHEARKRAAIAAPPATQLQLVHSA